MSATLILFQWPVEGCWPRGLSPSTRTNKQHETRGHAAHLYADNKLMLPGTVQRSIAASACRYAHQALRSLGKATMSLCVESRIKRQEHLTRFCCNRGNCGLHLPSSGHPFHFCPLKSRIYSKRPISVGSGVSTFASSCVQQSSQSA